MEKCKERLNISACLVKKRKEKSLNASSYSLSLPLLHGCVLKGNEDEASQSLNIQLACATEILLTAHFSLLHIISVVTSVFCIEQRLFCALCYLIISSRITLSTAKPQSQTCTLDPRATIHIHSLIPLCHFILPLPLNAPAIKTSPICFTFHYARLKTLIF